MPNPPSTPSTRIDRETYRALKVKLAADGWTVAGLIREAVALYLNGEIVKPEEPQETEGA